jgi:hypothetical protein
MSYDFHLVPRTSTGDVVARARALLEAQSEEVNPGPVVPAKEAKKRQLADALIEANPQLESFAFGYSEIATQFGISEDEARTRYRHIELNGPEGGNGIQITISDDLADITVPYWHRPEAAAPVFDEIWAYLRILERKGDFCVYDPQLDKIIDLAADREAVLARYGRVVAEMPQIVADSPLVKKPWWKFW